MLESVPRPFERPATISLPADAVFDGAVLEGLVIPSRTEPDCAGAVIAAPHPLMGGSMETPVVTELAFAFEKLGVSSLRFNWRGVGGSAGESSGDLGDAQVDWAAAWDFQCDSVDGPMTAAGYSFGAVTALLAASRRPRPQRLLLVAPPPRLMPAGAFDGFDGPVLIVAGDRDDFVEIDELRAMAADRSRVELVVIEGADHFFMLHLAGLRLAVDGWLESRA